MYKIRLHKSLWYDGVEFLVTEGFANATRTGKVLIAKPPEMITVVAGEVMEPTFRLGDAECQYLMDQLYQIGFKPTDGKWNPNEIDSLKLHLTDMRKIVENKLRIKLT